MQFSDLKLHFQLGKYVDSLCCSWRGTPCSWRLGVLLLSSSPTSSSRKSHPMSIPSAAELPFAVPRPQTSAEMFERQGSFRVFPTLNETVSPFKRQMSLRVNDLPSNVQRRQRLIFIHRKHNVGIRLSTTRCVKVTRQYYSLC